MPSSPLAAIPDGPVPVPTAIQRIAGSASITPVWRNGLGGLTFRLGEEGAPGTRFAKWVAHGTPELDLAAEADRLRWAGQHRAGTLRVPEVLDQGRNDEGSWLVMSALPGRSAVHPDWVADPATAARGIGAGLRLFHDTLPVAECPFSWSIEERRRAALEHLDGGTQPADWSPEHRHLTVPEARALLAEAPEIEHLVVCHGDACAPNTLLTADGGYAAHVDLDSLGVADAWADLAVAAWSTVWNYGPGYEDEVYAGYGVAADPERIAYYRLLWDLS